MKADDLIDGRSGKALISTEGKKKGQQAVSVEKVPCLAKDCKELIQPYLPLCKLCYLQSMAGKVAVLALRDNLGNAVFNTTTKLLDFPSSVPKSRFPKRNMKKGKALVGFVPPILRSLTTPVFDCSLIVTAGQEGGTIMNQSDPIRSSPVTSGQDGTVGEQHDTIGGGASSSNNGNNRETLKDPLEQHCGMELPLTLCTYVDSSYGNLDPALGCYVSSYSHNSTLRSNQIDGSLQDPASTNPNVFRAQTPSENVQYKPIGAFPAVAGS
jgi:hypothetical protein